jgi:hypothetical protein
MQSSNPILIGTASGTFLSVLPNLNSEDVLKTVVLAAIGAVVSFVLSMVFKFIVKKYRK